MDILLFLLFAVLVGGSWIRRRAAEIAAQQKREEAAHQYRPMRAPSQPAPVAPTPSRPSPSLSGDSYGSWRGSMDAGSPTLASGFAEDARPAFSGFTDGGNRPAQPARQADAAPPKAPVSQVLPAFSRESVVQAVIMSEILGRPRGFRRVRKAVR